MSRLHPDFSTNGLDRIARAAEYTFVGSGRSDLGRITLETGTAEVVLGGERSVKPGHPAVLVVGLARHDSGLVVYEHHKERWPDRSTALHRTTCIPNLDAEDCIRLEASPAEGYARMPRYRLWEETPTGYIALPESGCQGAAGMIERFADGTYEDLLVPAQLEEALVAMGGADTIFRDPAMREFARMIAS